jgi:hypothetical protein
VAATLVLNNSNKQQVDGSPLFSHCRCKGRLLMYTAGLTALV